MLIDDRIRRYRPPARLDLPDRAWPARRPVRAPRWLSTDLRDGNQALAEPMTPDRKRTLFELLVRRGYREIEVGFPAASRDETAFVRTLIEDELIPEDVRISVMVPARDELIASTVAALEGAPGATVHVYNATCPTFRAVVFGMTRDECRSLAVEGVRSTVKHLEALPGGSGFGLEYSPELANETEPEFLLEVCEAVMDVWQPEAGRELILNFPATVERSGPNDFADLIEWLARNLSRREHVCLSVHTHNDRGTGVAASEFAVLAGAQRVEGCLFGGGERAGNVCLVTMGLNLYTHGIDPGVDFSDLDGMRRVVEACTGERVSPRHPYAGDLVYTAFSGSHQDAIHKGFDAARREAHARGIPLAELPWRIPYLPLDPADLGRGYEDLVRINSQSGKGGVGYVMSAWYGLRIPRGLRSEFARSVQALAERAGGELTPDRLRARFAREYLVPGACPPVWTPSVPAALYFDGAVGDLDGADGDALTARLAAVGIDAYECCAVAAGAAGTAPDAAGPVHAYAACGLGAGTVWGAGVADDPVDAARRAVAAAQARRARGAAAEAAEVGS